MLPLKKSSRQNKNVDLLANSIETANELSYRIDGLFRVIQTGLILFFKLLRNQNEEYRACF